MESDFVKLRQIKPALAGYLRKSELYLKSSAIPDDDTVHDVRVLLKKARSVLKLAAPQMDNEIVRREIMSLREAGRELRSLRESTVLRKTLKEIKKRNPEIFKKLDENVTLNQILKKPDSSLTHASAEGINMEQIIEMVSKSGYRIRFEPMNNLEPLLLFRELEMTYNRIVNSYLICRNNSKQSTLHELRKSSKDLLYQLWFFKPLNPAVIKVLENKIDLMSQNLGKYNDLAQLIKAIGYKYEYKANPDALDELILLIRDEQDKCLSKVWPTAYKIFCPGQKFVNILGFKMLVK